MVGPWPSHGGDRVAVQRADQPADRAATEKTRPITPRVRCRSRASSTMSIASAIAGEQVGGAGAQRRSTAAAGCRARTAAPRRSPGRGARPAAARLRGSRLRISPTNSAEPRKLTASTATATGAVSHWMTRPASGRPGDLVDRADGLQLGVALDQVVPADQVRQVALVGHVEEDGEYAGQQGDQRRAGASSARRPTRRAGTLPRTTARPRSPAISTLRRRSRSTQAPAGSPISRNASGLAGGQQRPPRSCWRAARAPPPAAAPAG